MRHALIIDREKDSALRLTDTFERSDFSVDIATGRAGVREALLRRIPDLIVIDVDEDGGGFDALEGLDVGGVPEIWLMSRTPSLAAARRGMRLGASNFLERPVDPERLRRALGTVGRAEEPAVADAAAATGGLLHGRSPVMRRLFRLLRKVAPTAVSVLVAGETGTGKERVARTLHRLSGRAAGPFVPVNCGAIAKELMESELFGHRKGAFTGAVRAHRGLFQQADGGTLYLDEITEMPPALQVKLLRVLEDGAVRPVGGERERPLDVRVIASTNRDPEAAVADGRLREDLYYRIAQFPLRVPALRERGDDVIELANLFLAEKNRETGERKSFDPAVQEVLRLHGWPGNVRELANIVARAHVLAGERIAVSDLPANVPSSGGVDGDQLRIAVGSTLEEAERRLILATLEHFGGNKKQAAETLGISLKTLYNRLARYRPKRR